METIIDPVYLIASAVAIVASIVIVATLYLSNRETSYEKAVLEQRRKEQASIQEVVNKQNKKEKDKKKQQPQKKKEKKDKTKELKDVPVPQGETEPSIDLPETVAPTVPVVLVETAVPENKKQTSDPHKHDHVEFKASSEVITLDDEIDAQLSKRKVVVQNQPKKPILLNKTSAVATIPDSATGENGHTRLSRGNSFEIVHPKDDYELIKSKNREPTTPTGRKSPFTNGFPETEAEVSTQPIVVGEKKKEKKKPATPAKGIADADNLTLSKLLQVVKSVALNDEEIQLLVNELLNRESDGSASWSQRNDPVASLKKSLADTETALKTEKGNLESSLARVRELREELATEKKAHVSANQSVKRFEQELQKTQAYIHQITEKHRSEVTSLKNSLHAKQNEDRASLGRLTEENRRLKEIIQKMEGERSNLEALPRLKHELEQLRTERRHREEALVQENQALKEHLQTMTASRQQDEYSAKQKIAEMAAKVKERDSAFEELNKTKERLNLIERESRDKIVRLESSLSQVTDSYSQSSKTLEDLRFEKDKLAESNKVLTDKLSSLESIRNVVQEKEQSLSQLQDNLKQKDSSISQLQAQLEATRSQLTLLEASAKQKPSDDVVPKPQFLQLQKELNSTIELKNSKLTDLEKQIQTLSHSKDTLDATIRVIEKTASCEVTVDNVLSCLQTLLVNQKVDTKGSVVENGTSNALEEVESLKNSLRATDEALKEIERKASEEQETWIKKLSDLESDKTRVEEDNRKLVEEKKTLERTIKELQSLQETFVDMEDKLKELQSKLQGEDAAKKDIATKCDEVARELSATKEELERKSQQLDTFEKERNEIDSLKTSLSQLQEKLDKELQTTKDLHTLNVKLKSQVKIGQDSLKAEMKRTDELMMQLKTRNGSASTPCLNVTNGSNGQATSTSSYSLNQSRD